MAERMAPVNCIAGWVVNIALTLGATAIVSGQIMRLAEAITGDRFSWPMIAFMSAYPADVRNGYLLVVAALVIVIGVMGAVMAPWLGASLGKRMFGGRLYRFDGTPATRADHVKRTGYQIGLALLVMLPGPVLGFLFGSAADVVSLLALFAAVVFVFFMLVPFLSRDGVSQLDRAVGVFPGKVPPRP